MRHKFLDIGEPDHHPLRKIATVVSGLRYAVLYDWSVAYKLVLSVLVLAGAFALRAGLNFLLILIIANSAIKADQGDQGHGRHRGRHRHPDLDDRHRRRNRSLPRVGRRIRRAHFPGPPAQAA
ncbi:hypothetical protein [Azonexus sp.]|uniref:hypothetical protein n=1 Tax=Azonexus sp. TaxID=1872668 RepID=UPI0035B0640F